MQQEYSKRACLYNGKTSSRIVSQMLVHKKGQSEFTYNACVYRQTWVGRVAPCVSKLATRDKERKGE